MTTTEQAITLPDGSSHKVLVSQVYVNVLFGDLNDSGAILAGKQVNQEAKNNNDAAGMEAWREDGINRVALHTLVGGLTGGVSGAVGAGSASAAATSLDQLQTQLQQGLQSAGLGEGASHVIAGLASGSTAAAIGSAASGGSLAGGATAFNADMNNRQLSLPERQNALNLAAKSGGKYTAQQIEDALRVASNTQSKETAASNIIIDPSKDNALGNDPTDAVASRGFDKGAVFNYMHGSVLQVNRDGTPLGSKPLDPEFVAYIQANTGGANSPYKWVMPQVDTTNPNAGLNAITPANNGCVTAECAAGVTPAPSENRTVEQIDKDLKAGVCKGFTASVTNTVLPGSVVMSPVYDSAGKVVRWALENGFDKASSKTTSFVICGG